MVINEILEYEVNNQTVFLGQLSYMNKLESLAVINCPEISLDFSRPLKSLKQLTLIGITSESGFAEISQCNNVSELYIDNINLTSSEPLSSMKKLDKVKIYNTNLWELDVLDELNVQYINVFTNPIYDYNPILNVPKYNAWYVSNDEQDPISIEEITINQDDSFSKSL